MGRMKYFKDCDVVVTEKEGLETKPLPYPSRTGEKLSPEEIEELVEKYIQDQDVIADFVVETDVYEKKEMEEHQKVNAVALWMSGKFQKAGYNKSVALSLGQRVTRRLYDMQQHSEEFPEEERQIPTVVVPPEDTDKPEPKVEMPPVQGSDKLFSKKILGLSGDAYKIYACMVAKASEQKEFCFSCAEYEQLGLRAAKEKGMQETECKLFKVVENTEIMRLQIIFDGKPEPEVRSILKKNGFRWSPKNSCWQRQLTNNARYSLDRVKEEMEVLAWTGRSLKTSAVIYIRMRTTTEESLFQALMLVRLKQQSLRQKESEKSD